MDAAEYNRQMCISTGRFEAMTDVYSILREMSDDADTDTTTVMMIATRLSELSKQYTTKLDGIMMSHMEGSI